MLRSSCLRQAVPRPPISSRSILQSQLHSPHTHSHLQLCSLTYLSHLPPCSQHTLKPGFAKISPQPYSGIASIKTKGTSNAKEPKESITQDDEADNKDDSKIDFEGFLAQQRGEYLPMKDDATLYPQLIDAYRLYIEDQYAQHFQFEGLYAYRGYEEDKHKNKNKNKKNKKSMNHPEVHFKEYLRCAKMNGVLPSTWSEKHEKEIFTLATDEEGENYIWHAVDEDTIMEKYPGEGSMVYRLRCIAQAVYDLDENGESFFW